MLVTNEMTPLRLLRCTIERAVGELRVALDVDFDAIKQMKYRFEFKTNLHPQISLLCVVTEIDSILSCGLVIGLVQDLDVVVKQDVG